MKTKSPEIISEPFAIFEVTKLTKMNTNLDNPTENWLPVPNYEKLYSVSDLGNVKALALIKRKGRYLQNCPEKYLQQKCERRGYRQVTLCKDLDRKTIGVHQLVAKAFIDNPLLKPTVNHKDGDKSNNKKYNLEWATHKEQINHADKTGLRRISGEDSKRSKLTEAEVIAIRASNSQDYTELANLYGVYATTISKIKNRKTWKHVL